MNAAFFHHPDKFASPRRPLPSVKTACPRWAIVALNIALGRGRLNFQPPAHGGNRKNSRQFSIGLDARRRKNHKGGGNEPEMKSSRSCRFLEKNPRCTSCHFRHQKFFSNMRTDAESHVCRQKLKPRSIVREPLGKMPDRSPALCVSAFRRFQSSVERNKWIFKQAGESRWKPGPTKAARTRPLPAQPSRGTREKQPFSNPAKRRLRGASAAFAGPFPPLDPEPCPFYDALWLVLSASS
jgi:hypothetical protein